MFSQSTLLLALATSATAHMRMAWPVPYGFPTLDQAPLEAADFPCKQRPGVYDVTTMNQWNAGETQKISFLGTAVHGGGSCQFSITTDPKPTKDSQWKVIQSVVGGCPSDAPGNITPANADATNAAGTFPVTMPKDIPSGQYTFAWTWQNKIGNREFYMNCAPIQVGSSSGGASAKSASSALSSLPDMFVTNLPATECTAAEGQDFQYPNPGQNVITGAKATPGNKQTGAGCAAQNKMGAGNGQMGSPSAGTPAQPSGTGKPAPSYAPAPSAAPPVAPSAYPSAPGGVFAPGASSAPAKPSPAQPSAAPSTPSTAPQTPPKSDGSGNNTSGGCTPCTNDGGVVCMGTTKFGLCNRGCAVAQDLAAGMSCKNGAIVASTKRSLHFPRAHLYRRHGSSRFM